MVEVSRMHRLSRIVGLLAMLAFVSAGAAEMKQLEPQIVSSAGGTLTVTVALSAGTPWSVSEDSDWLTITSPASGTGTAVIVVDYLQNPTSAERSAFLVFTIPQGDTNIEIRQRPTGPWTLTLAGGEVLTTPNADGKFAHNTTVAIAATVPPGKRFVNWVGSTSTVADVEAPNTTVLMLTDVTLAARFEYAVPQISGITPATGPDTGNTQVSIQGLHFTEATEVRFGTETAIVSQVLDNVIICRTPAQAAGTVQVTVRTPGGVSNTGSFTYTATTPAAPVLSQISPASGPGEGGTQVTIAGTNLLGATSVTFGGTPATNVNASLGNFITCTTPAHASGNVSVVVTAPGGESNALTFRYEGGGGGCGGSNKELPTFEEMLSKLVMGLLLCSALFGADRFMR
jgi:hypothetical protein